MKALVCLLLLAGLPYATAVAEPDIGVTKSVNIAIPAINEPVEFTVQVSNFGDQTAVNVVIDDMLPPEMEIPAGTAAFASVGVYDLSVGKWRIGNLDPGANATLVVPAVVTDPQPPACIVNYAISEFSDESNDDNNESRAVINRNNLERCVDISADPNIGTEFGLFGTCDSQEPYEGTIDVYNAGPDAARDVVISFTQTPIVGASIRFDDARCAMSGADVCTIAELAAGETIELNITSDLFQNYTGADFQMVVSLSTSDVDYVLSDNVVETNLFAGGFSSCEEIDLPGTGFGAVGGPACFIATAAYGSSLDPHLDTLRHFRDRFLLTNKPGRSIVAFYYQYSPPLADFIADHDWLRAIVRAVLTPIVYAIEFPGIALLLTTSMIALLVIWIRRRRKSREQSLIHT